MAKIMTVLGEIKPEDLGLTSMHEHILMDGGPALLGPYEDILPKDRTIKDDDPVSLENIGPLRRNHILTWDGLSLFDEELMEAEVKDFKESGASSLLELSALGIRCNVAGIKRISQKTGLQVIACTGFYIEASWPEEYRDMTIEEYQEVMLKEVKDGIGDTGVFPGHLKIAMASLSPQEEKTLRAAARVANETGLSLTVHPSSKIGGNSVQIVKILLEEGMKADRIVIAHVTGTFWETDLKTLVLQPGSWGLRLDTARALLDLGVNISMEFIGNTMDVELAGEIWPSDWQRFAGIVTLLKEGYGGQMVMGTDLCVKMATRRFGGEGYCRLTKFALPTLRDILGVSEYALHQMVVKNPARILAY